MASLIHRNTAPSRVNGRAVLFIALTLFLSLFSGLWLIPNYGILGVVILLMGIGVAVGVVAGLAIPIVGVLVLTFAIPLENTVVFGPRGSEITLVRIIGLIVFSTWGLYKIATRESWAGIFSSNLLRLTAVFVALAMASLLWAEHYPSAFEDVWTTIQLFALAIVIIDVVNSRKRMDWVVIALILSGFLVLGLTLMEALTTGANRSGNNVSGGVNQTSMYIIVLIPLAFYLLRVASKSPIWRLVGLGYIALAPWSVVETFSRTSLVILPPLLATQLWGLAKGSRRNRFFVLIVALVVAIILMFTVDWGRVTDRVNTIVPSLQGIPNADGRLQSSRMQHWLGAVEIFNDYPVLGVGYGNYGYQFLTYQFNVPDQFVKRFFTKLRSPHSSILGMMAELGVVGTVLWVLIQAAALFNAQRSWSAASKAKDGPMEILSQALFFALVTYFLFGLFGIIHLHKLLWLLFGLTIALRQITRQSAEEMPPKTVSANLTARATA